MKKVKKKSTPSNKKNKKAYKVRNWKEYNQSLVNRGDVTLWVEEGVLKKWISSFKKKKRGRPFFYSDSCIKMILSLRFLYKMPLRNTEGFLISLFRLMNLELPVPHYSCLSRRASSLKTPLVVLKRKKGPLHLVIDATGLKVYGESEWKVRCHGKEKRRTWRKVHMSVDPNTFQLQSIEMTKANKVDGKVLSSLLKDKKDLGNVYADAAYMYKECFDEIVKRQKKGAKVFIDLRERTILAKKTSAGLKERNRVLKEMWDYGGKTKWKRESGYSKRNLAETQMFRWKQIFGPKLLNRKFENQKTETMIKANVLNKLTSLGMPKTQAFAI